jgi:hypothetical protein
MDPEQRERARRASRESIARRRKSDPEFAESQRQAAAKWRAEHPEAARTAGCNRNQRELNLKKLYGLDLNAYEALLNSQGGVCAICGEPPRGEGRNQKHLHVDHDHASGKNRGLLCGGCNTAMHKLEKDPDWGIKALNYLARYIELTVKDGG